MSKGSSKYDPLRRYLVEHARRPQILVTLSEIEEILGFALCKSAKTPSWWANTQFDAAHSQLRAWRDAGYKAYFAPDWGTVEFCKISDENNSCRDRSGKRKGADP